MARKISLEKQASTYLKGSCESRWGSRLSLKTMEGALHRAHMPSPWPSGSADWPDYLRIFFLKLWTDRLPPAAERHKRSDRDDGELVPPHCPHCLLNGETDPETQTHLLHTCPKATHRSHILSRDINNIFRKYIEPYTPYSTIDVLHWATMENIPLEQEDDRVSGLSDIHDRLRILRRGPQIFHLDKQRFAEPWLQHILKTTHKHLHSHELHEILQIHTPANSIDPHLLNGIAQSLSLRTVLSPIASNYHIDALTPLVHAQSIDTSLLLSTLPPQTYPSASQGQS
jgi:hypothetical protein